MNIFNQTLLIFSLLISTASCYAMFSKALLGQRKNITHQVRNMATFADWCAKHLDFNVVVQAGNNMPENPLLHQSAQAAQNGNLSLAGYLLQTGYQNALMDSILTEQEKLIQQWHDPIEAQAFKAAQDGKLEKAHQLFKLAHTYPAIDAMHSNPNYEKAVQAIRTNQIQQAQRLLEQANKIIDIVEVEIKKK